MFCPDSFDSIVFVMRLLTVPTPELSRSLLDASKHKLGLHFEHPGLWDLFTQIIFQLVREICIAIFFST